MIDIEKYKAMSTVHLHSYCKEIGLIIDSFNKHHILFEIMKHHLKEGILYKGIFERTSNNYGFLRDIKNNFIPCAYDIYINHKLITEHNLKSGDEVECTLGQPKPEGKLLCANKILNTSKKYRACFEELTAIYPTEQIKLFHKDLPGRFNLINRIIDLLCPIGFGQRALIVSPPKCGKTTILHSIALGIRNNYPDKKLIVVLVGERPEEVTEMRKTVPDAEIVFSTFDEPAENHIKTVELIIEKAKRLVEEGSDVVVLLDSITRLVRSYNYVVPSSGKVLTGGLEPESLQRTKRFFGNARNTEEGKSLTIIATCLVETGSRMDDGIFEEFKGTGNGEIKLETQIANHRIFPAINVKESRIRNYEKLVAPEELPKIKIIERFLSNMDLIQSINFLIDKINHTKDNGELIAQIQQR